MKRPSRRRHLILTGIALLCATALAYFGLFSSPSIDSGAITPAPTDRSLLKARGLGGIHLQLGNQKKFGALQIRLVHIEPADPQDFDDDEAELELILNGRISHITVREKDTTYFDRYEITADLVQPAKVEKKDGPAEAWIDIRYTPSKSSSPSAV